MTAQAAHILISVHLATVAVVLVLFILTKIGYQSGRTTLAAWSHNVLRGFYLLGLLSGGLSIGITPDFPFIFLKIVTGLFTLVLMEIHLVHKYVVVQENRPTFSVVTYMMIGLTIVLGMIFPAGISL